MTMYLPNPAVRPAESDPVEFLDIPPMYESHGESGVSGQLSPETRIDLRRMAYDYLTELVATHGGDSDDVRSIIHDLRGETFTGHRRAR